MSTDTSRTENAAGQVFEEERSRRITRKRVKFNDYVMLTFHEAVNSDDSIKWLEALEDLFKKQWYLNSIC